MTFDDRLHAQLLSVVVVVVVVVVMNNSNWVVVDYSNLFVGVVMVQ